MTRYHDGSFATVTKTKGANGDIESQVVLGAGNIVTLARFRRDSNGNFTTSTGTIGEDGIVDWSSERPAHPGTAPRWMRDIGGNPGDDGTTDSQQALADWAWRQHRLGRHTPPGSGPPLTTLVNPGDPDYEGAYVNTPSLAAKFTGSIAVNPATDSASSAGSSPTARAWRMMVDDVFNGPGPGTNPGRTS